MATLLNTETGIEVTLVAHHLFGRSEGIIHTLLAEANVSRMHASIIWDGESWNVVDSSTNGTFVNTKKIDKGDKTAISLGDHIQFGRAESTPWKLVDDTPPCSMLMPISGGAYQIALEKINAIPSEDDPVLMIYQSPIGHWICEGPEGVGILNTGSNVAANGMVWQFIDARPDEKTTELERDPYLSNNHIDLQFYVSRNEEHVHVKVSGTEQQVDLGVRNHHYLLLQLARCREVDLQKGISQSEAGWVDKALLGKMLGVCENHLNIQIFRIRQQLVDELPGCPFISQIIQRRTGELRLECHSVAIQGGALENAELCS